VRSRLMSRPHAPPFGLTEWVAVLDTAPAQRDLDEEVEALVVLVPDAVLVERVDCHQGLPDALGVPAGTWCCGLVAESHERLERAIVRVRERPRFRRRPLVVGEFRLVRLAG
jgi:hypothetical protein